MENKKGAPSGTRGPLVFFREDVNYCGFAAGFLTGFFTGAFSFGRSSAFTLPFSQ